MKSRLLFAALFVISAVTLLYTPATGAELTIEVAAIYEDGKYVYEATYATIEHESGGRENLGVGTEGDVGGTGTQNRLVI